MFAHVKGESVTETRRERLRDATLAEIKETARKHLRVGGPTGISLRAVARDMGMTAPALYRYFASLDGLVAAMIEDYKDELSDTLEAVRDALPAEDTAGRLFAITRAFRRWSLDHRAEFALVFGARLPGYAPPETPEPRAGGLFVDLWRRRPYPIPSDAEIPPELRHQLENFAKGCGTDTTGIPLGMLQVFLSAWIHLYGFVTMEVFGHQRIMMADAEPMFEAELARLAAGLEGS
jgi:AcrR family transcriptional regulator